MVKTTKQMSLKGFNTILVIMMALGILAGSTYGGESLLDPSELAAIGLQIAWQRPLPIYAGEAIKQFVLREDRLYLLTDKNYAISLHRSDGRTIFIRTLATEGFQVNGWQLEDEVLLSVIGNRLTGIAPNTGSTRGERDYGFSVVCPPASNNSGFYLAGDDHRVHAIGRQDQVVHYRVGAISGAPVSAVEADESGVILASTAGDVLALNTGIHPTIDWEFKARDAVVGPIIAEWDAIFFASRDSYVYRLHRHPGNVQNAGPRLAWRCQCSELLDIAPWVTDTVVYQRVGRDGVKAIDKTTGTPLWFQAGARDLLAQSGPWAYLWTHERQIVVMDNEKGQWAHMIAAPNLTYTCTNTIDNEIYLADDQGRIVCLKEIHPN